MKALSQTPPSEMSGKTLITLKVIVFKNCYNNSVMERRGKKAVFLDKDDTIHANKEGYLYKAEDIDFLPGVFEGCRRLQDAGYLLVITTNQSGIGRGMYTEGDFENLMEWMQGEFRKERIEIAGIYHCPHIEEDNCECRKPKSGMYFDANRDLGIELDSKSWSVGDGERDVVSGKKVGLSTILISPNPSKVKCEDADYVVTSFTEAVDVILSNE